MQRTQGRGDIKKSGAAPGRTSAFPWGKVWGFQKHMVEWGKPGGFKIQPCGFLAG